MSKVYSYQYDNWKKWDALQKTKFFLIYGPDEGGVEIMTGALLRDLLTIGDSDIIKQDFKEAKSDCTHCITHLNSISLFGNTGIVVLSDSGPAIPKEMAEILSNTTFPGRLIFKAGDLKTSSGLRKFVEGAASGVAIGCYKEDAKQIEAYIKQFFAEKKVEAERGVASVLTEILPPNKLIIASELEKLCLYANGRMVSTEDVEACVSDSQEMSLDELCNCIFDSSKNSILKFMKRARASDSNYMLIIKVMQRYVGRVLNVLASVEAGLSVEQAVEKLKPPVFFKQKDSLVAVCKKADSQNLLALSEDLLKLELVCKKSMLDQYMTIENFLIKRIC